MLINKFNINRRVSKNESIILYNYQLSNFFSGDFSPNTANNIQSQKVIKYFFYLSIIFLLFSIVGLIVIMTPLIMLELNATKNNSTNNPEIKKVVFKPEEIQSTALATLIARQDDNFRIRISKINLDFPIIKNVDINSEKEYTEALQKGIAQAKGSYLPGENGPIFLFSHSTDSIIHISQYNAKFYALKDLVVGDKIEIDYKQKIYTYQVIGKTIIDPTNLEEVQKSNSNLILQTCWPPGTDWQRLVVFANLI